MKYDPDEMSAADYALDMDPDGFIKNVNTHWDFDEEPIGKAQCSVNGLDDLEESEAGDE